MKVEDRNKSRESLHTYWECLRHEKANWEGGIRGKAVFSQMSDSVRNTDSERKQRVEVKSGRVYTPLERIFGVAGRCTQA